MTSVRAAEQLGAYLKGAKSMTRSAVYIGSAVLLLCGFTLAAAQPSGSRTFVGNVSDSACGLHHTMGGNAKRCTLMCVGMGSKFVLADEAHHIVYALSDQSKARPFAGEKVRVVGTLKRSKIEVVSITAAKPAKNH
jgi:hypothetical protein